MRAPIFSEPANSALVPEIYETSARDAYVILIPVRGAVARLARDWFERYLNHTQAAA